MLARLALALAALTTFAACTGSDTEKLEGLLDDYAEERRGIRNIFCTCPEVLGYSTSEECEAGLGDIDEAGKRCIVDAFQEHVSLGEDYFECVLPLQDQYRDCLVVDLACGEDWFVPCEETFDSQVLETCPTLPNDVATDYTACLPG